MITCGANGFAPQSIKYGITSVLLDAKGMLGSFVQVVLGAFGTHVGNRVVNTCRKFVQVTTDYIGSTGRTEISVWKYHIGNVELEFRKKKKKKKKRRRERERRRERRRE